MAMIAMPGHQLEEVIMGADRVPHHAVFDEICGTRSPSMNGIGSCTSDIFSPSIGHIDRSMLPVRWMSMLRDGADDDIKPD